MSHDNAEVPCIICGRGIPMMADPDVADVCMDCWMCGLRGRPSSEFSALAAIREEMP